MLGSCGCLLQSRRTRILVLGGEVANHRLGVLCYCRLYGVYPMGIVSPLCDEKEIKVLTYSTQTIGYGDLHPSSSASQIYTIFLAFYGIVILGIFLGIAGDALVSHHDSVLDRLRSRWQRTMIRNMRDAASLHLMEEPEEPPLSLWQEIWFIARMELPIFAVVALLALGIGYVEGWSIVSTLYWVVITGSTVGFGDMYPVHMKVAAIFFLPFCVAVLGEFLARIASLYMRRKEMALEREFLQRSLTLCDIETMDADGDGRVGRETFVLYMLVAMQKIDKEDIEELNTLFDTLDVVKDGWLSKQDLVRSRWRNSILKVSGQADRQGEMA